MQGGWVSRSHWKALRCISLGSRRHVLQGITASDTLARRNRSDAAARQRQREEGEKQAAAVESAITKRMYFDSKYFKDRVRRRVLPADHLYARVRAVYAYYGRQEDPETNKPLFNEVCEPYLLLCYSIAPGLVLFIRRAVRVRVAALLNVGKSVVHAYNSVILGGEVDGVQGVLRHDRAKGHAFVNKSLALLSFQDVFVTTEFRNMQQRLEGERIITIIHAGGYSLQVNLMFSL